MASKLAAVPDNSYAEVLQVLRRQAWQDGAIDLVLAECRLIPFEANPPQPSSDIHDGAYGSDHAMITHAILAASSAKSATTRSG